MKKKKKYEVKPFFRLLAKGIFFFFTKFYRISAKISEDLKKSQDAVLLLANHVGFWDPFVIGYFLKKTPHFITSDATMRYRFKAWILKKYGVIPIRKNLNDTTVIRQMLSCTKQGESIALFPEATRTWTGETLHIDDSIGKLAKLLDVPVVIALTKGMFLFNPRWSGSLRKAKVKVFYKKILDTEQIRELNSSDIAKIIRKALYHNEMEYQKTAKIPVKSSHKAEFMNKVLFYCPSCGNFDGYTANGNTLSCKNCGFKINIDKFMSFSQNIFFRDINHAFKIQKVKFSEFIYKAIDENKKEALFYDKNIKIYKQNNDGMHEFVDTADVFFYIDKIEIKYKTGNTTTFKMNDLRSVTTQLNETLEIYVNNTYYRFWPENQNNGGIKWELACTFVWHKKGQVYKISKYYGDNFFNI